MKKIYLLVGGLVLTGGAMAQFNHGAQNASIDKNTSTINRKSISVAHGINNGVNQKVPLLTEDFEGVTAPALPAGFSVNTQSTGQTTAAGGNTAGNPNGYTGWYTGDEVAANTGGYWPVPSNGSSNFAMANDDIAGDVLCEERLVFPELDFTGQTGMGVQFDAFHDQNYGSGDATVEVSTDGGTTWTAVMTLPVDAANWQHVVADLSAYDGNATVTIGILWNDGGDCTVAGDNWGTGLAVDNIVVDVIPDDDLTAAMVFSGDISTSYEYTKIPLSQVAPMGTSFIIANNGTNDQTDVDFAWDINSGAASGTYGTASTINSFERDTLHVTTSYTPSAVGNYTITCTATMGATDANPADNVGTADLEVTDLIWARDYTTFDGSIRNISGGAGDQFKIGHLFLVNADEDVKAIDVGIDNAASNEDKLVYGEIHYWDGSAWVYLESTIDHTITAGDLGNIVTLQLASPVSLTTGWEIMVVAGHYGGPSDGSEDVRIATAGVAREGTVLGFDGSNGAFQLLSPPAPVVRLNFDPTIGIAENANNTMALGQNIPNPFNNVSTINYTVKSAANITLDIVDMTGKKVMSFNEGNKPAGDYTITVDGSELAEGVYFYTLSNGENTITKSMVVTK